MNTRSICEIASDISKDWKKVNFAAKPYLDAMFSLDKITDNYCFERGESIVLYFLANASTYKGENAKKYKKELRSILKQSK